MKSANRSMNDAWVVASCSADVHWLCQLLKSMSIVATPCDVCNIEQRALCDERIVLIVHRATPSNPEPPIPVAVARSRILVISDCQDERLIAQVLNDGIRHYSSIDDSDSVILARITASLRSASERLPRRLDVFPFCFYPQECRVTVDGIDAELNRREFELAYFFFCHRGRILSRGELMREVWALPESLSTRRLDTSTSRIRRKLRLNGCCGWRIHNVYRIGYQLQPIERSLSSAA